MGPMEVKHGGGVTNHDSSIFFPIPIPFTGMATLPPLSATATGALLGTTYSERLMPPATSAVIPVFLPLRLSFTVREGLNVETLRPLLRGLLLLLVRDFCK